MENLQIMNNYPINLLQAWLHGASGRNYQCKSYPEGHAFMSGKYYAEENNKLPYQL